MRRKVVLCVFGAAVIVFGSSLRADIVKLKDGQCVTGKIIAKTDKVIMIQSDSGTKKIYQKDIHEIIKESSSNASSNTIKKRFRMQEITKVSISDLESNVDAWFKKIEPLHQRQAKKIMAATIAVKLNRVETVYSWVGEWCTKGLMVTGLNEIEDTKFILETCSWRNSFYAKDIGILRAGVCLVCKGDGQKECTKCRGEGKVSEYKMVKKTSAKKGTYKERKIKWVRCLDCKGRGKILCFMPFHAAQKRAKKLGGVEKMAETAIKMKKSLDFLNSIKYETNKSTVERLRELAEQAYRKKYYYITLELLKKMKEEEK